MSAILSKTQAAIAAHLATIDLDPIDESTQIFTGMDDATRTLPAVVVDCRSAEASGLYSGNWLCRVELWVEESADDTTEEEHLAHTETVFNVLLDDGIVASLTAALADYTAFGVIFTDTSYELEGRRWRSRLAFDVECAPSDIA